ncbi:unnamed protein product [Blepharisma stoltei]|uniref:Uncharacterized protein n=1 Tax=Blepharisma stoltei TaxID=1481888 RepID=A0AAU9JB54_9CILI|nr:unnamed protein product [Blepharisma stoltei]
MDYFAISPLRKSFTPKPVLQEKNEAIKYSATKPEASSRIKRYPTTSKQKSSQKSNIENKPKLEDKKAEAKKVREEEKKIKNEAKKQKEEVLQAAKQRVQEERLRRKKNQPEQPRSKSKTIIQEKVILDRPITPQPSTKKAETTGDWLKTRVQLIEQLQNWMKELDKQEDTLLKDIEKTCNSHIMSYKDYDANHQPLTARESIMRSP